MVYLDYGLMAIRDDQGRIQPTINMTPMFRGVRPNPMFAAKGRRSACRPMRWHATSPVASTHLIQPERVLGSYVVPSLERAANDKLDGTTIIFGIEYCDKQPEMVLAHVLRNYGGLWGGMIASDRRGQASGGRGRDLHHAHGAATPKPSPWPISSATAGTSAYCSAPAAPRSRRPRCRNCSG